MKISSTLTAIVFLSALVIAQPKEALPQKPAIDVIAQADALVTQGKPAEAVELVQATLEKNPADPTLNFWLAKTSYRRGMYQAAVERLSVTVETLKKDSVEYKEAVRMLGMGHYVLGHLVEAAPYLEKFVGNTPENQEVVYALGVVYIQTRKPEKARQTYAKLFGLPPTSAAAHLINAQMHQRQRFEETAETELLRARELDPKLPQVNFVLGELAVYKAEIDKGIAYLRKEIEINPSNSMAYYRWGEALSRQLKWDEAIPPLQKSIWLNPFFSGPYIVLGKVYSKKGDLSNAENLLRRSTAIDPNNFGAHHLLAQVLQQAGRAEEAKAEFVLAEKLRGANEQDP